MRLAKAETRLDGIVPSMCSFASTNPTSSSNLRKSRIWKPIDTSMAGGSFGIGVAEDGVVSSTTVANTMPSWERLAVRASRRQPNTC